MNNPADPSGQFTFPAPPDAVRIRALEAEVERYRALFKDTQPLFCAHTVALAQLAIRDPESGETRVREVLELWKHTPTGPVLSYLLPDDARALAANLNRYAVQAETGIIAVSAGAEKHLGNGHH